jgi:hypothetical protein
MLTAALFIGCIIVTWFTPGGWPLYAAVLSVVCSGLALVVALAPPRRVVNLCPMCGWLTLDQRRHYRKVHDL